MPVLGSVRNVRIVVLEPVRDAGRTEAWRRREEGELQRGGADHVREGPCDETVRCKSETMRESTIEDNAQYCRSLPSRSSASAFRYRT